MYYYNEESHSWQINRDALRQDRVKERAT